MLQASACQRLRTPSAIILMKKEVACTMAKIDLTKYGITGTTEIVYNPSFEELFIEETKPELEGFKNDKRGYC